jgi:dTDP-4-dehydrorhamnose reductase
MVAFPILVIGAGGQLARALGRRKVVDGHPILCRGRPEADIADPLALQRLFGELSPVAVVNAAAYTAVDKAEEDRASAFAVNAEGPEHLARLCRNAQIPLIHISTDYVFDGTRRTPYRETDAIAPLGVYGASKAAGEAAVRQTCPRHLILRTSWLYSMDGHNFLNTMIRLAGVHDELSIVDDQHGTPTWTHDVSAAIVAVLRRLLADGGGPWGTYHLTNSGQTTWFGFAAEIFRLGAAAGLKTPRLKAITTAEYPASARRPAYSVLDNSKIGTAFDFCLPPWQTSLAQCFAQSQSSASEEKVA